MIDRICQYSVIILVGNLVVLQIVAIATDYWEYRSFNIQEILPKLKKSNLTKIHDPIDTSSYISIYYLHDDHAKVANVGKYIGNNSDYQPPAYIRRFFQPRIVTTNTSTEVRLKEVIDLVVLFEQYGNLFRDCDNLEAGVRRRLGIADMRHARCHHFIANSRNGDYVATELPVIIHLERTAFALSVLSICSIVSSLIAGMYGSVGKDKRAMIGASSTALASGISLTTSIALFHVKCHLLKRREFMEGKTVPFKRIIDGARVYSYGWSFVLAWICVVLCFVSAWTWLHKAQDINIKYRPSKMHARTYYAYQGETEIPDYV
ncbi:uncharacterized protein LOC135484382 [Lineus longissimus]|uniref:uncharacterized protein LOC135484382 n=1 Tax=Lineus longissimus TaxID=88925 RepID=UPI00315CEED6